MEFTALVSTGAPCTCRERFLLWPVEAQAAFDAIDQRARDSTQEKPVSDEIFRVIRRMYAYDRRPLKEAVEAVEDSGQWRKETVSFDAGYGNERMRAYLFVPKNASPPFQTVIHFPTGGARLQRSSRQLPLRFLDFIIRSGLRKSNRSISRRAYACRR